MLPWTILLGCVLCGAAGQIALKLGVRGSLWQSLLTPVTWMGLLFYGVAFLLWLAVLRYFPLSVAYPSLALGYVLVILAAVLYLGEGISLYQGAGVAMIVLGVGLLGTGR